MTPKKKRRSSKPRQATSASLAGARADEALEPTLGPLRSAPGFLLRRAGIVMGSRYRAKLEGNGIEISPVQGAMLILIDENPGLNQIELARLMQVEGATLSESITRVIELDLVHRFRAPHDKRAFALYLTKKGRALRQKLDVLLPLHQELFLHDFTREEREQLVSMLLRIIEAGARLDEDERK